MVATNLTSVEKSKFVLHDLITFHNLCYFLTINKLIKSPIGAIWTINASNHCFTFDKHHRVSTFLIENVNFLALIFLKMGTRQNIEHKDKETDDTTKWHPCSLKNCQGKPQGYSDAAWNTQKLQFKSITMYLLCIYCVLLGPWGGFQYWMNFNASDFRHLAPRSCRVTQRSWYVWLVMEIRPQISKHKWGTLIVYIAA